jgi:hypothetical protein
MEAAERKLISLQGRAGGVAQGIRTHLRPGRLSVTTAGFDPNLQLLGSDPWNSSSYTGLIVPKTPTKTAQSRYLMQLARIGFNNPENAWIRGLRLYTSLFGYDSVGNGPFELEITSPMWRFALGGGNISFHVQVIGKSWRSRRNPQNSDSFVYLDSTSPAILYQTFIPGPIPVYIPPNAGRPWGKPVHSDLGNIHDNRFPWRDDTAETSLNIPIPAPCDVAVYASVWQHDPGIVGALNVPTFSCSQFAASGPEDRFWATYNNVQYGRIAASLIIGEEMGKAYEQTDEECPVEWRSRNGEEPR